MKREEAAEIHDHLVEACKALDNSRQIALANRDKAEWVEFNRLVCEVFFDLSEKLLHPIYEQYPDLLGQEPPTVSSELTWSEVRLPPSVTEQQLDELIFSLLTPRWQKTAKLALHAAERCEKLGLPISDEVIAARLEALSDSDRIEGAGDLRMWRHSEVRLRK